MSARLIRMSDKSVIATASSLGPVEDQSIRWFPRHWLATPGMPDLILNDLISNAIVVVYEECGGPVHARGRHMIKRSQARDALARVPCTSV